MEFRRFLKRGTLFLSPLIAWMVAIVAIDPFDYFNCSHLFSEKAKLETAGQINSLTFNMLKEAHDPCENLIIGDSRAMSLPLDRIERLTGQRYLKLAAFALKLNESVDLFYFASSIKPVKSAVFTINFNEYNEYAYADRVHSVETMIRHPLAYIFDRNVAGAAWDVLKASVKRKDVIDSEPPMSQAAFWTNMVTMQAPEYYSRYGYPTALHEQLVKMVAFAKARGTQITFIVVPHHADFQCAVAMFGLNAQYLQFKNDMSDLGVRVIDYDYVNDITTDRADFRDPIHYNDRTGNLIADEVFRGPLKEGRLLDRSWAKNCSAYLFH
ncbi:MAG TPA: hypothetical protein VGV18_10710 [Verrucomicrobiae bacterium]|nr:hypothetical protein [Verrucomicrobiae bacterium]